MRPFTATPTMKPEAALTALDDLAHSTRQDGDDRLAMALERVINNAMCDAAERWQRAEENNLNAQARLWRERAVSLRELSKRAAVLRGLVCEALSTERKVA